MERDKLIKLFKKLPLETLSDTISWLGVAHPNNTTIHTIWRTVNTPTDRILSRTPHRPLQA
jgi:hypothetical protein